MGQRVEVCAPTDQAAGIVEQNIEATEMVYHRADHGFDRWTIHRIGGVNEQFAARIRNFGGDLIEFRCGAGCQTDSSAFARTGQGDCSADSATTAGHKRDPSSQLSHLPSRAN